MSEQELISLEIDGIEVQVPPGSMVIQAADAAGIEIPRFCYHPKLSVAANCRMCMVEVEKAPKPLPACATPVAPGMKVHTRSPLAREAQQGTMEFLLINHPLDCPICDQGGECELQDVALGYGRDVSRYTEAKRAVRDKDIGPLIATEMTRCIHCTRCVRFGEEIAGLRELGATGRGEHMEIGTFVARSIASELSGNVIDLCPVGALTARPSRYRARPWELMEHAAVSPHDAVGSNLAVHTRNGRIVRVVPRDNEAINECWIADRDRFSYEAVYAADRVTTPQIRDEDGQWRSVSWETALVEVSERLQGFDPADIGALLSPSQPLEALYLAQKYLRALGVSAIDHRVHQLDFRDDAAQPLFPWLGLRLPEVEEQQAVLLVGANPRKDQPLLGHRLRKAALRGARVHAINGHAFEPNLPLGEQIAADPAGMVAALAGVVRHCLDFRGIAHPPALSALLAGAETGPAEQAIATDLLEHERVLVLLGPEAAMSPQAAALRALAAALAEGLGGTLGHAPQFANEAGAWLAGAVPHRRAGGLAVHSPGADARAMLEQPRRAYVLAGVEPADFALGARALAALRGADYRVVLASHADESLRAVADVLLPLGTWAETGGTWVNLEGHWQSVRPAVRPLGEARPGWKVWRMLGSLAKREGFAQVDVREVRDELAALFPDDLQLSNCPAGEVALEAPLAGEGLQRISAPAIYTVDALVRRAPALQQTPDGQAAAAVRLHPDDAAALGVAEDDTVLLAQDGEQWEMPLTLDEGVPAGCVFTAWGLPAIAGRGSAFGPITLSRKNP